MERTEYEASLMRAIFSVAFHACARIGEMVCSNGQPKHAILAQNVCLGSDQVAVTFVSFKHHKGGTPVSRMLWATSKEVCPARLLTEYAAIRQGTWTGPLFVWRSGRQVEASEVRLSLRRCLERAGEDTTGLTPHSFRIGSVSKSADRGASDTQLRRMGRWRSNAYMRYVRPTQNMPWH